MDQLNQKLDRAVEAAKIKPSAKLKEYQNNEKLVAINERIEEAMNFRKELRDLEVKEAMRVEKLRNENAEKQRNALLSNQKKEMVQLEAKIETGRHNLKIKMDKELYRLQKEIGLHVNDIKRIQGLMSRLAIMHGKTNDEIKRNKEKARNTMKLLSSVKKVQSSTMSPERAGKTGGATATASNIFSTGEDNPINMLLFGNKMKSGTMTSGMMSLGGTMSSNSNYMNVIIPLKQMLRYCEFTTFDISA
jgi:hypothetical protein